MTRSDSKESVEDNFPRCKNSGGDGVLNTKKKYARSFLSGKLMNKHKFLQM